MYELRSLGRPPHKTPYILCCKGTEKEKAEKKGPVKTDHVACKCKKIQQQRNTLTNEKTKHFDKSGKQPIRVPKVVGTYNLANDEHTTKHN